MINSFHAAYGGGEKVRISKCSAQQQLQSGFLSQLQVARERFLPAPTAMAHPT